ncbi:hypothetical protein CCP3SC1AL1_750007 [Gammaproteobacteria bacterium]
MYQLCFIMFLLKHYSLKHYSIMFTYTAPIQPEFDVRNNVNYCISYVFF